jgi:hypothetical protein
MGLPVIWQEEGAGEEKGPKAAILLRTRGARGRGRQLGGDERWRG